MLMFGAIPLAPLVAQYEIRKKHRRIRSGLSRSGTAVFVCGLPDRKKQAIIGQRPRGIHSLGASLVCVLEVVGMKRSVAYYQTTRPLRIFLS